MKNNQNVFEIAKEFVNLSRETQKDNIVKAGNLIVEALKKGGIIHAFGSGHAIAGALEIVNKRDGFIPAKLLVEPSFGKYEIVEGFGSRLMEEVEILGNDVFVIISNSGVNPLIIEIALSVKNQGNKLIAITSLEGSKSLKSRHSSNKKLFELADVVLDNHVPALDVAMEISSLDIPVIGVSSISNSMLIQPMMAYIITRLKEEGLDHLLKTGDDFEKNEIEEKRKLLIEDLKDRLLRNDNAIIG